MSFPAHNNYSGVYLFNESNDSLPVSKNDVQQIIAALQRHEQCQFAWVEIAFVDEDEIIRVNKEYLDHQYVTDIISFRYDESDSNDVIEGTLYCCARQIRQQATENDEPTPKEFLRVIIHGLLHLCGYEDTSKEQKLRMTEKEDFYLDKLLP